MRQLDSAVLCFSARANEAIVRLPLDLGANTETRNPGGRTSLHNAAPNGYEATTQLLLDRGADIEAKDPVNHTPLHREVLNGYEETSAAA